MLSGKPTAVRLAPSRLTQVHNVPGRVRRAAVDDEPPVGVDVLGRCRSRVVAAGQVDADLAAERRAVQQVRLAQPATRGVAAGVASHCRYQSASARSRARSSGSRSAHGGAGQRAATSRVGHRQLVGAQRCVEPDADARRAPSCTPRPACRRTCGRRPAGRWATSARRRPRRPGAPPRPAPRRPAAAASRTAPALRPSGRSSTLDGDARPAAATPSAAQPAAARGLALRDDRPGPRRAGARGRGHVGVGRAGLGDDPQLGPQPAGHDQRPPQRRLVQRRPVQVGVRGSSPA